MGEGSSFNVDVEKLIAISNELSHFFKDDKDLTSSNDCFHQFEAFQSQSLADYNHLSTSIADYQRKINACKQRTAEAETEAAAEAEKIQSLQKELDEELQREQLLREELRVITDEISDLDRQRTSVEEQKKLLKRLEQDQQRAEMKLSLYASVTSIIPDLDDQSKVSGNIVEREQKVVQNFEIDPLKLTSFDACNSTWKMINL